MSSSCSEDAPCGNCQELVKADNQALECDLCSTWFHVGCVGASTESYELFQRCDGLIPWFCPSCKPTLKTSLTAVQNLKDENEALRFQLAELHEIVQKLLGQQLSSSSPPSSPPSSPSSTPPLSQSQLSKPPPGEVNSPHNNLNPLNPTDKPTSDSDLRNKESPPTPASVDNPLHASCSSTNPVITTSPPSTQQSTSQSLPSKKQSPPPIEEQELPEIRFIRRIDSHSSIHDITKSLKVAQINSQTVLLSRRSNKRTSKESSSL